MENQPPVADNKQPPKIRVGCVLLAFFLLTLAVGGCYYKFFMPPPKCDHIFVSEFIVAGGSIGPTNLLPAHCARCGAREDGLRP